MRLAAGLAVCGLVAACTSNQAAATLSTQEYKLLATGEGGFVLTNDDDAALAVARASGNPTAWDHQPTVTDCRYWSSWDNCPTAI